MDDFTFELYRGLYRETLSYGARQARYLSEHRGAIDAVDQSRFLISRVYLKRVAYFFATATVMAVLFVGSITLKSQREVTAWNQHAARVTLKQIAFTKDIEVALMRTLGASRNFFLSDLTSDRAKVAAAVGRDLQFINDRVSSLEFLLKGTTALERLTTFQIAMEEWKLQTLDSFVDLEKGNAEYALVQWTERSEALGLQLSQQAEELSALAEDFARRESLRLEAISARHATVQWAGWTMLFALVAGSAWVLGNFIGAIGEFLMWFRRMSWDLLSHTEKLAQDIHRVEDPRLELDARAVSADVAEMRLVLKRLLEVFAGNINGERFHTPSNESTAVVFTAKALKVLKFDDGSRKMREILESTTPIDQSPSEQAALNRAVGE